MSKIAQIIEEIEKSKGDMEFMKTGFSKLDKHLDGGFLRKELVIVGAHTGIGKSYIASQLLFNIAKQGFKSTYFSLEISNEMIVSRLLGAVSNIKSTRIRAGLLNKKELQDKLEARGKLLAYNDYVDLYDDIYELEKILDIIRATKPDFVVVDFVQNVYSEITDERLRLTNTALRLQQVAKEVNCCVLVLSQLSNRVAREGVTGNILEYSGSGGIAMVADLGFVMDRNEIDQFSVALRKNRRGISHVGFDFLFKQPGGWIVEV